MKLKTIFRVPTEREIVREGFKAQIKFGRGNWHKLKVLQVETDGLRVEVEGRKDRSFLEWNYLRNKLCFDEFRIKVKHFYPPRKLDPFECFALATYYRHPLNSRHFQYFKTKHQKQLTAAYQDHLKKCKQTAT